MLLVASSRPSALIALLIQAPTTPRLAVQARTFARTAKPIFTKEVILAPAELRRLTQEQQARRKTSKKSKSRRSDDISDRTFSVSARSETTKKDMQQREQPNEPESKGSSTTSSATTTSSASVLLSDQVSSSIRNRINSVPEKQTVLLSERLVSSAPEKTDKSIHNRIKDIKSVEEKKIADEQKSNNNESRKLTFVTKVIVVDGDSDGLNIIRFLKKTLPFMQPSELQEHLRARAIRVRNAEGNPVSVARDYSYKVCEGDTIKIRLHELDWMRGEKQDSFADKKESNQSPDEEAAVTQKDKDIILKNIIYRDKDIIAINKPVGVVVQGAKTGVSIADILKYIKWDKSDELKIVHRLDTDTSGVLILARNRKAATRLAIMMQNRVEIEKEYWALVIGIPPLPEGKINQPIRIMDNGRVNVLTDEEINELKLEHAVNPSVTSSMRDTSKSLPENTKAAVTEYKTIDHVSKATGRKHQLRVHCAQVLKTPICGDIKYGGDVPEELQDVIPSETPMFLHHRRMSIFGWKEQDKPLIIVAPLPSHMQQAWKRLGFRHYSDKEFHPQNSAAALD